jgi:signal transduction histidine kinase/ligand-binding sensor domain-containing protein
LTQIPGINDETWVIEDWTLARGQRQRLVYILPDNDRMRSLIIICLLLSSYCTSRGQQLFTQNFPIEVYQAASQNWSIRQDKQGVIYFANTEGLLRYDGSKWDLLPLPSKDAVYSVDIDSDGRIYVCSDYDLGYFQKDLRGTYKYTSLLAKIPGTIQQGTKILLIRVFDNKVFFVGDNIIYLYTNNHFKILSIDCTGLLMSKNSLYAERGDALYRYNNEAFDSVPYFRQVPGMKWKWVTDYSTNSFLILDEKNLVWIVNEKYPDQWNIFSEELNRNLKDLNIQNMTCLDNGNIAIQADDRILFYNKEGKLCARIARNKLIQWGYLLEDKQHNLWVNAESDIIQIVSSSPLSYYDQKNGLNDYVLSLGKQQNHHYIGTSCGILYQQDRNTFIPLPGIRGNTWAFYNAHNKLYAIHDTGILELQGRNVNRISDVDQPASLCILRNDPDKMIAGTFFAGLWLLERNVNTWNKKKIEGFQEEARSMLEDGDGNIWVSHVNRGLSKLRLNKQLDSVVTNTFYDTTSGLPANYNNRIYRLDGKIVITTINGIYSYNRNSDRFEPEEKYNRALGNLFCVYSLTESEAGDIYFWGAKPQQKEMAGVLKKQVDGTFELVTTPFNKIAIPFRNLRVDVDAPLLVTSSGDVWIGNNRKIYSYNPNQTSFFNDPIELSIQKVSSRDSLIYQHSSARESFHILPYTFNNLKFEFLCSFIEDNDKNQYQYKLKGFENKWSKWTTSKEAFFTNLPEGDYTLYVRAKNLYDVTSAPTSFSFRITPPWYRTRLAYISYSIAFMLLFYLVIQINTGRVKRRQVYLEGIVKEKTKELIDVNEELLTQSNLLSERNHQLQKAHTIIENQNKEIKNRNETLEEEVHKRTQELVKYNQQLEQFAFVTAHNLRGPVARILGLGNVLRMIDTVPDEVKTINDKLVFTAHEIDSVIRDLNQILHIKNTPSHLEELSLETEINRVIAAFEKDINKSNAIVRTDFTQVQFLITSQSYFYSIIYHLLSNAIKFRHPERVPHITISAISNDNHVGLAISDNGLGIDLQKSKDKLFTLYSRFHLHVEGKGLGLYLVKTQLIALGGTIEVKSEVNIGTTFKVLFKRIEKPQDVT